MAGILLFIPALALAWWGRSAYPHSFPPLVEELDRKAWVQGAENLFPDRYQQFHQHIQHLRNQWRAEKSQWWVKEDVEQYHLAYDHLVKEGFLLIEASRQKSAALRLELEELLQPEQAHLGRIRSLSPLFNLETYLPALSKAESLLRESQSLGGHGKILQARTTGKEALHLLQAVEIHILAELGRYANTAQILHWERKVHDTIRASTTTAGTAIVVLKAPRRLLVYQRGRSIADYPVRLGFSGLSDKLYEGDGATPEGQFHVIRKKEGPDTKYHKALLLDYPTTAHQQRFQKAKLNGLHTGRTIGSLIEIHGDGPDQEDFTSGCIALKNSAMDDLFSQTKPGTPVTIVGALNTDNEMVDMWHQMNTHIQQRTKQWQRAGT